MAFGAIVLAGGGGRRLGGRDKPALPVGGRTMLARVLDAAGAAAPRVVVGPTRGDLPPDVRQVREDPPGGGPVAAVAAGMAALTAPLLLPPAPARPPASDDRHNFGEVVASAGRDGHDFGEVVPIMGAEGHDFGDAVRINGGDLVAVLAGDLPFLTAAAIGTLRAAVTAEVGLAVLVDGTGREQWLCAVWRVQVLQDRLAGLQPVAGRSMRQLVAGLPVTTVALTAVTPPPWYDCDTEDDYRRAKEWQA